MSKKKIVLGLGIAGGALLAYWLLSGDRRQKTREFVAKGAETLKKAFQKVTEKQEETDNHYV